MNGKNDKSVYIGLGVFYELLLAMVCGHIGIYQKTHMAEGFSDLLSGGIDHMREHFLTFLPYTGTAWKYFVYGTLISAFVVFVLYNYEQSRRVTMRGKEGGSAKWNTNLKAYNKKYTDPAGSTKSELYPSNNMILSNEVFMTMDTRQTRQNNNVLIIGGSGSGKSRFYVKPNLLQANACYVCTDPSGELLASTGHFLEEKMHYKIKIFNLMQMRKSHRYNPFKYLHPGKEEEVMILVDCLIENTTSSNKKGGDQFWENSERLLYRALVYYVLEVHELNVQEAIAKGEEPKEDDWSERNWSTIMYLLRQASVDENNAQSQSILDQLFETHARRKPNSIAVMQYQSFKQGAGKTLKSILISCHVRLSVFDIEQVKRLTDDDDMELTSMGRELMAYYVVTPQTNKTFNFLVAMLYSQMFQVLYEEGGKLLDKGKSFKYQIRFMLDEFVNVGRIPEFDVKIATMRKYGISANVIIQNIKQLEPLYEAYSTIIGNCDTMIYLGGIDQDSVKYVSELLGKQTIRTGNISHSAGKNGYSESFQQQGRELMTPDELVRMPKSHCIVIPAGQRPFYTPKFDYPKHPNYKYTGDADSKLLYRNTLDNMADEDSTKNNIAIQQEKKQTAFELECEMREAVKSYVQDDDIVIESFPEFLAEYESDDGNNIIFNEMKDVEIHSVLSDKEQTVVDNEVAKFVLSNISAAVAKEVIKRYKKRNTQNMTSSNKSGSVSPLSAIIEECKKVPEAENEKDTFSKIFG